MTQIALQKRTIYNISHYSNKNIGLLLIIFASIISLTIFQDYLESIRNGYAFYLSESILFKIVWILFVPILILLSTFLTTEILDSVWKTAFFIITPIFTHIVVLPLVFLFFSVTLYNGRYDIYKIITYTLANDFYKPVTIYSLFVLGHKYLSFKLTDIVDINSKSYIRKIIIGKGKYSTVVQVNEIYLITAATPYISLQLKDKKFLHTGTLKSISSQLDHKTFVRIHKSTIVNLEKVVLVKSRLNGDYDIFLENGVELRLSRTYVATFKSKFKSAHQDTV